ncbi:hypothetical protein SUGI_0312470 [Cryptomeria japonica]|nr:uncharacterized protein LOC131037302 isoform X2 [Cryptomeria japonica]GLJ17864.1 hypothetical protein SUGI_0312470 [Cryptomeria japonica]
MAKKRKSENTGLDEVEKTMYNTFCSAANSLSQLYTQAQNQQKIAFQAGERHGLEKLYQWVLRSQESGSRLTVAEVFGYLQNELDYGGDVEVPTLPASQFQNQSHSQQQNSFPLINSQTLSGVSSQAISGQGTRMVLSDQNKNSVFSNALSSPVRRSLQPFHMAQGGYCSGSNASQVINGGRRVGHPTDQVNVGFQGGGPLASPQDGELSGMNTMVASCNIYGQAHQNRESNSYCETDSTMDMHAESPARGFYQ